MVPFLRGHILNQPQIGDAGIIDQHIQVAVGIMNPFEKLSAALIVSGITHKGHAFHLVILYFQHGLHQLLLPVNAGDGEVVAHLGVADGDCFPDAAGSASYEYGFSVCHGSASFYYIV